MISLLARNFVLLAVMVLLPSMPSTLHASDGEQSGIESRGVIDMQKAQKTAPLGITPENKQLLTLPAAPLTAPPKPGWQYLSLFASDFQVMEVIHQVQAVAGGSTTEIPNPPARTTTGGFTWPMGDTALTALHLPDGSRVQEVLCVFNEAPFQSKDGHGQVTIVPLGLGLQIRKQKFGDPANASFQQIAAASIPNGVRTGVTVLQAVVPPNQAQPVQNYQNVYVLEFSRTYQGVVPAFNVPPVELRGCRIGYTLQ